VCVCVCVCVNNIGSTDHDARRGNLLSLGLLLPFLGLKDENRGKDRKGKCPKMEERLNAERGPRDEANRWR